MKVLILGCDGQLGQALRHTVPDFVDFVGVDLPELDITDVNAVREAILRTSPAAIVNAAAYTAVDQAESEPGKARAINVAGPRNVALMAIDLGVRLIHMSTDFVFDGESSTPYTADDVPHPLSIYGQTKLDGEKAVLDAMPDGAIILRTAWLYGRTGSNFVHTMLRAMREREELSIVSDQVGSPTWSESLAKAIWAFVEAPALCGIYHWTDDGIASWYEFAMAIQEEGLASGLLARAIPVRPISTEDYPTAARRPRYSVLDTSTTRTALNLQPAHWRANLRLMLKGMAV